MGKIERRVTIIGGIEITEVVGEDFFGLPADVHYVVRGERYDGLKQAMEAAMRLSDEYELDSRGPKTVRR
jgi:hypothetical protein